MTRTLRQTIASRISLAAGLSISLAAAAQPALAQWGRVSNVPQNAQLLFEWQGDVDREVQFDIYDGSRDVNVHGVNSRESRGRFVSRNGMPRGGGSLYVERVSGRGQVDVIQQPGNSRNGDGVVRIMDPSGGQGYYDIRV